MHAYVSYSPRTKIRTLRALKETRIFSSILPLDPYSVVLQIGIQTQPLKDSDIRDALVSIPTITEVTLYLEKIDSDDAQSAVINDGRIIHLFFDIDSTLTHPGIKELDRGVKRIFEKLRQQKCSVYFCTGRSDHEVRDLMQMYKTDDYGVAENG